MALDEEVPLPFLGREDQFCMKVSKVGCHKVVLVGLWGHIQSSRLVKLMVVA